MVLRLPSQSRQKCLAVWGMWWCHAELKRGEEGAKSPFHHVPSRLRDWNCLWNWCQKSKPEQNCITRLFVCLFQCRNESKHICKVHLLSMWIQNTSFWWAMVASMWYILQNWKYSIYLRHTIKKWKLKQKHIPLFLLTLPWGTNDWETIYWKWKYWCNQYLQSIASVIWARWRCILDNVICLFTLCAWRQLRPEVEYQARNSP